MFFSVAVHANDDSFFSVGKFVAIIFDTTFDWKENDLKKKAHTHTHTRSQEVGWLFCFKKVKKGVFERQLKANDIDNTWMIIKKKTKEKKTWILIYLLRDSLCGKYKIDKNTS